VVGGSTPREVRGSGERRAGDSGAACAVVAGVRIAETVSGCPEVPPQIRVFLNTLARADPTGDGR
jgi:hypothetical protein